MDRQLAQLRFEDLWRIENQSHSALDMLISKLRELEDAISKLPPIAKGVLNKRVSAVLEKQMFDTEVFIDVIETIAVTLPELSPTRIAEDVRSRIYPSLPAFKNAKPPPHITESGRPPLINLWESMPATTRVGVERLIQQGKLSTSLVGWLNNVANLLARQRPKRKRGAPRATSQLFIWQVASIWRRLGLRPGLTYDNFLDRHEEGGRKEGRVESGFQGYCRAALAAFGEFSQISARQVENTKKNHGSNPPGMPYVR
jgi:hypothetical protein